MQTRSQTKQLNLFSKRTKTKNRILWFILADFCLILEKNHHCLKAIHTICRHTLKYVTVFLHLSSIQIWRSSSFFWKYWSFSISVLILSAFMLSKQTHEQKLTSLCHQLGLLFYHQMLLIKFLYMYHFHLS